MDDDSTKAVGAPLQRSVRPVAWTLREELDARQTTCKAHLWFVDPVNSSWAPLYDQATLDAAVAAERERFAHEPVAAQDVERVLRELDDTTNQTWRGKRAHWASLVRAQAAAIERLTWDLGELRGRIAQMERDESKAAARKAADDAYWGTRPTLGA